ncbi:MAG TPA: DinB family protein [Gemmatimonadaceae bacterium]|nr:DinB family protein [Gemmatimonadaceae bacterium]
MHPRVAELFDYLDQQLAVVRAAYDAVPAEERDRPPAGGGWSPAQILSHLVLIERRVSGVFATVIAKARESGLPAERESSPILPAIDLQPVKNRGRKLTAPEPVDPRPGNQTFSWADYEAARAGVKAAVLTGDGLALGEVKHPHPVFGPLTMYEWVAFVGAHSARHAAQMGEASGAVTP